MTTNILTQILDLYAPIVRFLNILALIGEIKQMNVFPKETLDKVDH